MTRFVLIFDGCCGFCTRAVGWLKRLDRHGRVAVVPFQQPGAPEAAGLTRAACEQAAWAFEASGRAHRGAAAVLAALACALGAPLLLRVYDFALVRALADAAYRWVAANRARLPGVTPHCEQHPAECGSPPGC